MDSLSSLCLLILLAALTSGVESNTDFYIDGAGALVDSAPQGGPNPYLWFGPRLGRRKRTLTLPLLEEPMPRGGEDVMYSTYYDESTGSLLPLRSYGERPMVRLTRDEEEVPENSKAPPFAPRLGRRRKLLPFSPRLGRDLPSDRFERSAPEDPVKPHRS